jgi:hypothetical protein
VTAAILGDVDADRMAATETYCPRYADHGT